MTQFAAAPPLPDLLKPRRQRKGFFGFLLNNPTIAFGAGLLLVMLFIAVFAPWLGTVDPTELNPRNRNLAPSAKNWFGTDAFGRDIYSRVMYGARVSLTIGLLSLFWPLRLVCLSV
jgi:peptide/nickel transport system permease protein